jgi:23S rRNA pseudouridine2605 synthase
MPTERIQKILAARGVASRRASEAMVAAGRVTIEGRVASIGDQVDPVTARIEVDGQPIAAAAMHEYLAMHKPLGVTSTVSDRHAAATVVDLVPASLSHGARLYPVGRLDLDSEGLLLLTNDGAWAERVLHPRFGVEREYAIGVARAIDDSMRRGLDAGVALEEGLATLAQPLRLATGPETRRLEQLLVPPPVPLTWYRAVLAQGWKRQLRRMFGAVAIPIDRLVRVRIGPLRIDGLHSGDVRRLSADEVTRLQDAGRRPRPRVSSAR